MNEELKLEDAVIAPAPWHITPVAFSDPIITDANHRPVHYTRDILERIVEAVNRVDAPHGNAAKMREALSDACYAMFNFLKTQNGSYEEMANALDKAKAALAAPPRNCDCYRDEDDAFAAWHNSLADGDVVSVRNAFRWLFAKEGKEASNG